MKKILTTSIMLIFSLVANASFAQVNLKSEVFKVVVKQIKGKEQEVWESPNKIVPGDRVGYKIYFENNSDQPATNVDVKNAVPENTVYVANSAKGEGANIEFSADGGEQFSTPEALMVSENGNQRIANPSEYTHVRWILNTTLPPGAKGEVSYMVQVK